MYKQKSILAVIPARRGSKRLPSKNIKKLGGKPLLTWSISAALGSKYVDNIIVSTDSEEIAEIARQNNAEVPFLRPAELSTDTAATIDVLKHALDFYTNQSKYFDFLLLLQATSPLRTSNHIDSAIEMLNEKTDSVISVCEVEHSPLWCNTLQDNLSMKNFIRPEILNIRSQDLPTYYRINGAIYIAEIKQFYKYNGFLGKNTKAFIMKKEDSVDIDNEFDLKMAELFLSNE